jgi:PTH1 family peptidyl-tRNA hydrolase
MALDRVASFSGLIFPHCPRRSSEITVSGVVAGVSAILLKPLTYMNRSGEAVAPLLNFHKIPASGLLVIHDDLDMSPGRIKFVRGGGAGGHKGVRSIIQCLGERSFPRLKIGIGRPGVSLPIDTYVLSPFTPDERLIIDEVLDLVLDGVLCFLKGGIDVAMNEFNALVVKETGKQIGTIVNMRQ